MNVLKPCKNQGWPENYYRRLMQTPQVGPCALLISGMKV
jgi:hypothetical protein